MPFQLLWKDQSPTRQSSGEYTRTRTDIEETCKSLIPNFEIKHLFVSYDKLRSMHLYNLGMCYEKLFASSLAVKFYLRTLVQGGQQVLPMSKLYDTARDENELRQSLSKIFVDFSSGLDLPTEEALANSTTFPTAVIHNRNIRSAHHDMILPCQVQSPNGLMMRMNIPVSCKASFDLSGGKTIQSQLKVSKQSDEVVPLLIWLYLGKEKKEEKYQDRVIFLSGDGCCNGLALDMFILTKKLASQNNKS
jgi:hypothetical protein